MTTISYSDLGYSSELEKSLINRFMKIPEIVNFDDIFVHRGRFISLDFQVAIGSRLCFVSIAEGKIVKIDFSTQRMRSSSFIITASARVWEKFWQTKPEPWFHDLFAMVKKNNATIEGDLHPFMSNLQYFKDIMATPRRIKE